MTSPSDCFFASAVAEFRGPGNHHRFEDSLDDYDMDIDQRTQRMIGGRSSAGRIILLGDGSEVLTNSSPAAHDHDVDMLDQDEEDRDLQSQVTKGTRVTVRGGDDADEGATLTSSPNEIGSRGDREGTPTPTNENDPEIGNRNGDEVTRKGEDSSSPASTKTEKSEDETQLGPKIVAASDGPVESKSPEPSK